MSVIKSFKEFGKKRSNSDAETTHSLKLRECDPCDTYDSCQDLATSAEIDKTAVTFDGIVFNGVTYTIPTSLAPDLTDEIREWIESVLAPFEIDIFVKVTWTPAAGDNGTITVEHIGELTMASFTLSDGSVAMTRCCTLKRLVTYEIQVVDQVGPLGYNGSTSPLDNEPYAHVGTPATDDATAAQLKTDIELELVVLSYDIKDTTVTRNDVDEAYDVVIRSENTEAVEFAGIPMTYKEDGQEFDCA